MISEPKISVVVPVYNVDKYLPDCIRSLVSQTYRNLEIILCDDGSTDESGRICEEFAAEDNRIIIIHQNNSGVCAARNAAFKKISGDYVTFVDSDDYLEKNAYETAMNSIREHSADACFFGWRRIREKDMKVEHTFKGKNGIGSAIDAVEQALIFNGYAGHIWNKIFSTSYWQMDGKIDLPKMNSEYAVGEDCEWLMRMMVPYQKVVFLAEELYNYRVRSNSAININKFTESRLTEISAREKIAEEAAILWKNSESTARAKAYSRLIQNGKLAFKIHDKNAASKIKPHLKKNRKEYFSSPEIDIKRKIKAIAAEILIRLT